MNHSIELSLELDRGDMTAAEFSKASSMTFAILRQGLPEVALSTPAGSTGPGAKGDPIALGTILLTAFTSGSVVALINCIKSIYARDRGIKYSLTLPGGVRIQLDTKNIDNRDVKDILAAAIAATENRPAPSPPHGAPRTKPKVK